MLYDAVLTVKLPGNSPEDAKARLAKAIPHWPHEVVEINPCPVQPEKITGTGHITMPLMGVSNGR